MLDKGIAISVNNISKKYYKNKGRLLNIEKQESSFWALKNLNFQVKKGQIIGIIGPNGAGKSTLFKILSEVIPPTSGNIEYEGSILSILDIGTGFHPDLSGYENIFLNASILGMKKNQTEKKVEEIVDFSGIGDFIREPVKHYSSGMYLRLALSIALFTNNNILLLDEVISVGDIEFRLKAIQKIKELSAQGRTCLMISHDLGSVLSLCNYCIFLEKGEIVFSGNPKSAVEDYLDVVDSNFNKNNTTVLDHPKCRFIDLRMQKETHLMDESITFKITFEKRVEEDIDIVLKIRNYNNYVMNDCEIYRPTYSEKKLSPGTYETTCTIPANLFNIGTYFIDLLFGDKVSTLITVLSASKFIVRVKEWEMDKKWNESNESIPFRPICHWETTPNKIE